MKRISLKERKCLLVDDEDYHLLSRHRWNYNVLENRAQTWIKGVTIGPGRLIVPVDKYHEIDHINGNPLDNRKINLRICTRVQNEANKPPGRNNTSGYKGVHWEKRLKKWRVKIKENKKIIHLGLFEKKEVAAQAYNEAAKRIHGEFAWLNPV